LDKSLSQVQKALGEHDETLRQLETKLRQHEAGLGEEGKTLGLNNKALLQQTLGRSRNETRLSQFAEPLSLWEATSPSR
jgi:hypothetical protein